MDQDATLLVAGLGGAIGFFMIAVIRGVIWALTRPRKTESAAESPPAAAPLRPPRAPMSPAARLALLRAFIFFGGIAMVAGGAALMHVPTALIVTGLMLLAFVINGELKDRRKP